VLRDIYVNVLRAIRDVNMLRAIRDVNTLRAIHVTKFKITKSFLLQLLTVPAPICICIIIGLIMASNLGRNM
jgi:hypothetical protein